MGIACAPISLECGPSIEEIEREGQPPNEVVGHAENASAQRPAPLDEKNHETEWTEHLAGEPNRSKEKPLLGTARHFEVENAVEADDHPQAGEDLWVIRQIEPRQTKQPVRIDG